MTEHNQKKGRERTRAIGAESEILFHTSAYHFTALLFIVLLQVVG